MPISTNAFVRSTLLAIIVGLAALLGIVGFNFWLVGQARTSSDTVTVSRLQRSALVDLRTLLDDAETGQRGYLLTGDKEYLAPYERALGRMPSQIDRVRNLTANDPSLMDDVGSLVAIVPQKLAELRQAIELFDAGRAEESRAFVKTNAGRDLMDQARILFERAVTAAEQKIVSSVEDQRESITALRWVTIFGGLVIILVVGGAIWVVLLYMRQLVSAQSELNTLNFGLETRVRERTVDLGRANDEIQRFAYIVTHDLRAPLVNIMGFTSELETSLATIQKYIGGEAAGDESAAPEARLAAQQDLPEAIGFIRSSTRKMDGLINAILKLSREGRRVLRPESIQLEELIQTAAANVQHQVTDAGGEVSVESRVPQIFSDRLALEQIIGNLLDNAVKYRQPGRPLKLGISVKEGAGRRVLVEVEDNGRGIAKQDHERVFDLFRRSGSQDQQGEGIGLAHVRTMVRSLGGDITLRSELGSGTAMQLNLPRDLRVFLAAQNKGNPST